MASIDFKGITAYEKQLAQLGAHAEGVCKYAAYEGAAIVADAVKANTPVGETGGLRDSIALTHFRNENGFVYTKVTFNGYDEKGVPNALKANVFESGSSKMKKRQFIRPAVDRVKKAAEFAIETALDRKLKEYMK